MNKGKIAQLVDDDNSPAGWAEFYASLDWRVFPVHSINAAGCCTCGEIECSTAAKHPRTRHGCKDATTNVVQVRDWFSALPMDQCRLKTWRPRFLVLLKRNSLS